MKNPSSRLAQEICGDQEDDNRGRFRWYDVSVVSLEKIFLWKVCYPRDLESGNSRYRYFGKVGIHNKRALHVGASQTRNLGTVTDLARRTEQSL